MSASASVSASAHAPVLCFGELLLRLGAPGRQLLLQSPQFEVHVGGAEANVAVALARLGHPVRMVSTVPDSPLGDAAAGELRRHGVDTGGVRKDVGRMGLYFLVNGALQRAPEVHYDRAYSAFAQTPASSYDFAALLQGCGGVHLSGVTPAVGAHTAAAAQALVEAASARGLPVVFDGNYRQKLWEAWDGDPVALLRGIVSHATTLVANDRDVDLLLGAPQVLAEAGTARFIQAAERAFAAFPRLQRMAATLRTPRSVDHHALAALLVHRDGTVVHTPSMELHPIVDRIGTGDAFAAGLWHGWLQGLDESLSLHLGWAAGCLKHAVPGDLGLLDSAGLQAFLAEGGLDVRR